MKNLYPTIRKLVEDGDLSEPFSNKSISEVSDILKGGKAGSHSFLSKHEKNAPNNLSKFFIRVGESGSGQYRLLNRN